MGKILSLLLASLLLAGAYGQGILWLIIAINAVFAVSWTAGFCEGQLHPWSPGIMGSVNSILCSQSFGIHGFWPNGMKFPKVKGLGEFDFDIFQNEEPELLKEMWQNWYPRSKTSQCRYFLWTINGINTEKTMPDSFSILNIRLMLTNCKSNISEIRLLYSTPFHWRTFLKPVGPSKSLLTCWDFKQINLFLDASLVFLTEIWICYTLNDNVFVPAKCTLGTSSSCADSNTIELIGWSNDQAGRQRS